jgi:N-acetylmuramoyl-L-alanine amidase
MKVIRVIKKATDIVIPAGMTRKIVYGVSHCTAGPQNQSTEEIFNYWIKHNGWKTAGYHFDIAADGTIEQYVEIDQIANGVLNHNANSIHFCYKGGIDAKGNPIDNRTPAQKASQLLIVKRLKQLFPNIIFLGHRDFSTDKNGNGIIDRWEWIKSCPALDFRAWLAQEGLDKVVEPERIVYKYHEPLIKNETVKAIQYALGIKIDGWFGKDTSDKVKEFQTKNKLTSDGIVGEATAALLIKSSVAKDHGFANIRYMELLGDIINH